ncbi:MAG: SPFH/Band 7/PHB domain protein, partial [Patescibacteria group bacterium]|nr:SPFH/Band 7/PHB domain protein [Patescibacteria group bacterium]
MIAGIVGAIIVILFLASGIRIVRPTHRAVVERLGKYNRYQDSGIIWIMPFVEKQISVNITEQMTEAMEQEIITKDNLNAKVDAQVYFKVKPSEETVKASLYNVYNYAQQIIALAQTSLRNVIGGKDFVEVNSKRNDLNEEIKKLIQVQTIAWGIDIVRVELKQIVPPREVQDTMNQVIQANNTKTAAVDFATATETKADGERRAAIKSAEGIKQSQILQAEGEAQAITTVASANAKQIEVIAAATANQIQIVNEAA